MPQLKASSKASSKTSPDMTKTMNSAVKRAEEAIRLMTWCENPTPRPAGILTSFIGQIIEAKEGRDILVWNAIVCSYVAENKDIRYEGAATDMQRGTLLHMTPTMAEEAIGLAEKAVKAAQRGEPR